MRIIFQVQLSDLAIVDVLIVVAETTKPSENDSKGFLLTLLNKFNLVWLINFD